MRTTTIVLALAILPMIGRAAPGDVDCYAAPEVRIMVACIDGTYHTVELARYDCVGGGEAWTEWRPLGLPQDTGQPCIEDGEIIEAGVPVLVGVDPPLAGEFVVIDGTTIEETPFGYRVTRTFRTWGEAVRWGVPVQ